MRSSFDMALATTAQIKTAPSPAREGDDRPAGHWVDPLVDAIFVVGSLSGLLLMWKLGEAATIPYHMIFVLFAAVYGYRVWPLNVTILALLYLIVGTGGILVTQWLQGLIDVNEASEAVLMPTILIAMVWHARRRATLLSQVQRLHLAERDSRLREHEYARDTAHALRTPLTIARGHVELMVEQSDDPTSSADAEIVLGELDRLAQMAADLLTITKLEQSRTLVLTRCDLSALVHDVFSRWSTTLVRDWRLDCEPQLVGLADTEVVRRCLDALLENAIRATDRDDPVRLHCGTDARGDVVVIGVADGGSGIDMDALEHVFRRFWRGGAYTSGTGLGLPYVKAAANAHGGDAYASRADEGGADVVFTVPVAAPTANGRARSVTVW